MSHGWEEREEKRLQLAAEAKTAEPAVVEEWAIQDSATGEWFSFEPGRDPQGKWSKEPPAKHYVAYSYAACSVVFSSAKYARAAARIVPAPPREMTNTEAEAWLHAQGSDWWVCATAQGTQAWKCGYGPLVGYGDTLHGAIRAARKLERR